MSDTSSPLRFRLGSAVSGVEHHVLERFLRQKGDHVSGACQPVREPKDRAQHFLGRGRGHVEPTAFFSRVRFGGPTVMGAGFRRGGRVMAWWLPAVFVTAGFHVTHACTTGSRGSENGRPRVLVKAAIQAGADTCGQLAKIQSIGKKPEVTFACWEHPPKSLVHIDSQVNVRQRVAE